MLTPRRRAASRGLTLVELMVTITLLAMLMMVGLPNMTQWTRNTQIRTVAETLQTGLNKARNEAVRRNARVMFSLVNDARASNCSLSTSKASWIVSLQTPAGQCAVAESESTAPMILGRWDQNEGSANVTVAVKDADCSTAASTAQLTYDGFGRLSSGTAKCILLDHSMGSGNRALRLTISAAGTARLCDPAITNTTDPRKC